MSDRRIQISTQQAAKFIEWLEATTGETIETNSLTSHWASTRTGASGTVGTTKFLIQGRVVLVNESDRMWLAAEDLFEKFREDTQ